MLKPFLYFLSLSALLFAGEITDPRFDGELLKGMDWILKCRYDSAEALAGRLAVQAPKEVAGPFLLATLLAARYYDLTDTSNLGRFRTAADKVLELTEGRKDPLRVFYRGATLGYLGVITAKEGRWVAGALYGKKSSDLFKKLTKEGHMSSDVLGTLGSYHYWTSAFIKRFSWLPFIRDRREQGTAEILKSWNRARYLRFALMNSLVWIYYDQGRFTEALSVCDEVLRQYPGHRIFRQARLHVLFKLHRNEEARAVALDLLKEYNHREEAPVNAWAVRMKLGVILYGMGRKADADAIAAQAEQAVKDDYLGMRLERDIAYLRKSRY